MIEVRDVSYKIENTDILIDINLTIEKGEFAAIIGPNGAGKSTLLKIILGTIHGYKGEVLIEGIPNTIWLKNHTIAYLPQQEIFDRDFPATAEDIVLMGLAGKRGLIRRFTAEDRKKAAESLEFANAYHLENHLIGSLSGGEMQRVFIARALVCDSDYIFLDEPEAGVDVEKSASFYNLLTKLHDLGKTILLISHDINMMTKYSSFLICLNKTLHCHTSPELVSSETIKRTYGDVLQIIEKRNE